VVPTVYTLLARKHTPEGIAENPIPSSAGA
jgi:hypothetical protein